MSEGFYDYECSVPGAPFGPETVSALTSAKARYRYWLDVKDAWPDVQLTDVVVRSRGLTPEPKEIRQVREFNATNPVDTLCLFWPGLREGTGCISRVRYPAVVRGGQAVVFMNQQIGYISLSHVEVIHG